MEYTGIDFSTYDTFVKTSGVEKTENSLVWYKIHCKENEKWVSRKELLEFLEVSATALDNAIDHLKNNQHIEVSNELKNNQHIEDSIKKGGYNNRETYQGGNER